MWSKKEAKNKVQINGDLPKNLDNVVEKNHVFVGEMSDLSPCIIQVPHPLMDAEVDGGSPLKLVTPSFDGLALNTSVDYPSL